MNNLKICCKLLFLLSFFCISTAAVAQKKEISTEIEWMGKFKTPVMQGIEILKSDSNCIIYKSNDVMFRNFDTHPKGINYPIYSCLGRFDKSTGKLVYTSLKLKSDNITRKCLDILVINNEIHLFSEYDNKKLKTYYIYDETVDNGTLALNSKARIISEISYGSLKKGEVDRESTKLTIVNNRLIISYYLFSNEGDCSGYDLFDNQLKPISRFRNKINAYDTELKFEFDRAGNLYSLVRHFKRKSGWFLTSEYFMSPLFLYYYPKDGSGVKSHKVEIGDKEVLECNFSFNDKDTLVLVGLYSNKGRRTAYGAFSTVVPPCLTDSGTTHKLPFDYAFFNRGLNENDSQALGKAVSRGEDFDGDFNYTIKDIHFRNTGGFDFIAEKNYFFVESSAGNSVNSFSSTKTTNFNVFGDLYVFSCSPDGRFRNNQIIGKYQKLPELNCYLGGYLFGYGKKNELQIIYQKAPFDLLKKNSIVLQTIDASGAMTQKNLLTDGDELRETCMYYSKFVDPGKFLLTRCRSLTGTTLTLIPRHYFLVSEFDIP